jgi:hypothetical protein
MTWLPTSAVRERYRGIKHDKISFRTIDRWVERGILPKPVPSSMWKRAVYFRPSTSVWSTLVTAAAARALS